MAGVVTEIEIDGLAEVGRVLGRLSELDVAELAYATGELLVSSTQRRMHEEKAGPDGDAWAPWSPDYAATRLPGVHSLLVGENHLLTSIWNHTSGHVVRIGTPLPYGAVHQFGSSDGTTPARPYLGLSPSDRADIERMALDLFGEAVQ